ncbi:MAG: hypothetical protein A2Y62_15905 [Candidatus Fischerbacteria bacterium RBG_13_37_8]|uniref:Membrane dipeptidase n=1 Tax=Candidatus Fischerbacteria bacterium RBG_13_37_8 TaxID=1817863 RepID=A0A1F5VSV9_9BACT|nr:MAG: hypothetical protein A2Y62_15905 [Candidatus Fischerbacteria bacterium RBG_13_37_8]
MKKQGIIYIALLIIFGIGLIHGEDIDKKLWQKALEIHQHALVIDTHCDTPMIMMNENIDIGKRNDKGDFDLIRMKEGGVDAIFFAVFVSNDMDEKQPSKIALETIDEIYRQVGAYPELTEIAYSTQDIKKLHKTAKRAILIGMENGGPVEGSLPLLRIFYRLGVRYITLTHSNNNHISDSSTAKEPKWNGLSEFGKEVVKEMNDLGMIIDVSHISDKAFYDVIEQSRVPVIASHSCVRALCDVPRNMSDDMIKALAKNGGVIQINFFSGFLDKEFYDKSEEIRRKYKPEMEALKEKYKDDRKGYWAEAVKLWRKDAPPAPEIETLIDHIEFVIKLAGIDHVGLGSDFDGAGSFPTGLEDISGFPLITYHLLKRGYTESDIKKVLGENFMRIFEKVEKGKKGKTGGSK